ncbi:MAG: hypothetical protein QW637_06520, partial [Acidilobaceae archaeon]
QVMPVNVAPNDPVIDERALWGGLVLNINNTVNHMINNAFESILVKSYIISDRIEATETIWRVLPLLGVKIMSSF